MPTLIDRLREGLQQPGKPKLLGDHSMPLDRVPPLPNPVAAAVLVPILAAPQPQLLLTTRNQALRKHPGQIAFPGGRIDTSDEGPVAAALREANEEVGLDPAAVEILGLADSYRTGTGFEVQPVVGLMAPDIHLHINPAEVDEMFEVPLAYVLDPANHLLRETVWQGRMRRYYAIEWKHRIIWGATAGMLVNLAARLA